MFIDSDSGAFVLIIFSSFFKFARFCVVGHELQFDVIDMSFERIEDNKVGARYESSN